METIERIAMQIEAAEFDFVIYQAGMDVLLGDPAGGGLLTLAETKQRDRRVFEACARASIPIVWNGRKWRVVAAQYRTVPSGPSTDAGLLTPIRIFSIFLAGSGSVGPILRSSPSPFGELEWSPRFVCWAFLRTRVERGPQQSAR